MIDLSNPQRQSPFAIVLLGIKALRSLGIAQLAFIAFVVIRGAADGRLLAAAVLLILLFSAWSALAWWRYTFQLLDEELVVTKGVVRVDRLTVSVDRIQSIAIEQELLHRLTGLVQVAVDTAGSSQAEFTIDAIPRPIAEELQRQAVQFSPATSDAGLSGVAAAPEERIVFRHTPRRLLTAALTMSPWAGLALLVPLFAVGDQWLQSFAEDDSAPTIDVGGFTWWWVPVGVAAAGVFVTVLNVARVFFTEWELTLRTDSTSLRSTSGLVSRRSSTSNIDRVQVLRGRQNVLRRRLGLSDVQLSNVGTGDLALLACDDAEFADTAVTAGLTPFGELALDRRVHPAQVWLDTRNAALIAVVVAFAGWWLVGWWALLALAVVAPVWWASRRDVRLRRWSLGAELAMTRQVISSTAEQALLRKANAVLVTQTLFERRRGLGRVVLVTAAGTIDVGMLPVAEARAARDVILHAVETDHRPWM